jgi:hypothetical protein
MVLLAVLLQALSPLVHARLLSLHAATTGQRIGVAAFCLPSHTPPPPIDESDGPPPPRLADCPLCVGGAAPTADLLIPLSITIPPPPTAALAVTAPSIDPRVDPAPAAHRPRGPPLVV